MTCNSLVFRARKNFVADRNNTRELLKSVDFIPEKSCSGCEKCRPICNALRGLRKMGSMFHESFFRTTASSINVESGREYKLAFVREGMMVIPCLAPINLKEREVEERSFSV